MGKTIQLYGFSSVELPEAVKSFLEQYTGEGTVSAVEVGQYNIESRAHAKVLFTDSESADTILLMAEDQELWYDDSYLKARELNIEIVPKPKTFLYSMEDITLLFGCQVSKEKFSFLWRRKNVCVKFGTGLRQLYFLFSYCSVEYKLELSFENIWQIELHCPQGQTTKFLVFQLLGAPRVFSKDVSVVNYFKDVPDSCWIRDVDFTPSCCIGQSSALCLEIPSRRRLPNLRDGFVYYKEDEGEFSLEKGSPFSSSSDLVPIVVPPHGIYLPYKILFKINSLVQHGCLPGETLDRKFFRLVDPRRIKIEYIECALDKLYQLKDCCYDPIRWLTKQYMNYNSGRQIPKKPTIALDKGLMYVHRVLITPSKVYFCGPEVNLSNRVLRNYPDDIDNFLRVSFVDEDLDNMHSSDLSKHSSSANEERLTRVYERILSVLRDGIVIGDKKFEFLGFSSSQLRENSAWMFASREGLTADDIRFWMGDFTHLRNVAKYAARLGQSFSSSRETLRVERCEVELISDIKVEVGGNKYCFSDGIGKISEEFAEQVAKKCGLNRSTPSAFQIRYAGYKGVVAIDPTSSTKLSLRNSMWKYKSKNKKLDVLAWSKYQPCFLNRQLITLLSTLGIKDHVLEKKQKEAVKRLDSILTDPLRACDELELSFPGEITNILKEMLMCGYKPDEEPFLSMMLRTFHASKLLEIRTKTRIHIPNGRAMMGCLDETGILEYGQLFVQCSSRQLYDDSSLFFSNRSSSQGKFIVKGKVVVAKNPCLHPGDVRVLKAVDVLALHHMVDCVVFPQKGKRPHTDECSGSDLDGDMYFVCWDPELIPPQQIEAMDYTPAPTIELDHDVTMEEVEEYFTDYIVNDTLGIISNAHTVFADKEPKKANSNQCTELAKLFSVAVDFPKTGVPAKIPPRLRVKVYPDFMEKPDKPTYESKRVIGKLFRQVKDEEDHLSSIKSFTKEVARKCYDHDMEVDGFKHYIDDAFTHKTLYDYKLASLMDYYGIKTEAEILSGNVLTKSRHFNKKRNLESANYSVKSLIKETRTKFNSQGSDSDPRADDVYAKKASAWYYVTYHPSFWGHYNEDDVARDHFLSFAWCVFDKLVLIKRDKTRIRRSLNLPSLVSRFKHGFDLSGEV
ncbi:RNA-dependent RNA polymerase-type [Parasponia andersonii]|uniref:RNA-dependent RNA polymerase n=1 Tax=Parasponia andersonii TaxID=3476 RepID=A0A2P5BAX6_PARAD|nr:RNA-dependent RNA polymerase-type [Parasponia andersonii]